MSGLSTSDSISFGDDLVAGRKRVPRPAAGKTALRTFCGIAVTQTVSLRSQANSLRYILVFLTLQLTSLASVSCKIERGSLLPYFTGLQQMLDLFPSRFDSERRLQTYLKLRHTHLSLIHISEPTRLLSISY